MEGGVAGAKRGRGLPFVWWNSFALKFVQRSTNAFVSPSPTEILSWVGFVIPAGARHAATTKGTFLMYPTNCRC